MRSGSDQETDPALVNRLYHEAIDLADEARSYFGLHAKIDRKHLSPIDRLLYTCESLRVSTRLMHVVSWLMVRKAVAKGEISEAESLSPARQLGDKDLCIKSELKDLRRLPPMVASLSLRSQAIYERALRLQNAMLTAAERRQRHSNPVADMLARLEATY